VSIREINFSRVRRLCHLPVDSATSGTALLFMRYMCNGRDRTAYGPRSVVLICQQLCNVPYRTTFFDLVGLFTNSEMRT
jgi:hypothetical protein